MVYSAAQILRRNELKRKRSKDRRLLVIRHYGGKCACCGENRIEFLSIDHVNGGGCKERKANRIGSHRYKHIINEKFPKKYRVLCHNCNLSLGFYKYCPHKKESR